jgi:hypothetical protein
MAVSHCRLSEQAQKQLEVSGKFEDISLGSSRPSQIVSRFEELYTQGRMDALDFMENHDIETQYSNKFLLDTHTHTHTCIQYTLSVGAHTLSPTRVFHSPQPHNAHVLSTTRSIHEYITSHTHTHTHRHMLLQYNH